MILYITVLSALAACIITNSHYVGVYPTDLIANGGLFGDVIFFAVSGFCLTNVKNSFPKWVKAIITFISGITLEIYLVQMHIIKPLNFLIFPFNWLLITGVIVLLAFILNKISSFVQKPLLKVFDNHKRG